MLTDRQVSAVKAAAEDLEMRRTQRAPEPPSAEESPPAAADNADLVWTKANLRWGPSGPYRDIANVVRVLERHESFLNRFRYNATLGKVTDKGAVMVDWRIAETTAIIQERFLPEVPQELVLKALVIVSNRAG